RLLRGQVALQRSTCGVSCARVLISLTQPTHAVLRVGAGLVDRYRHGPGTGVRLLARVDGQRLKPVELHVATIVPVPILERRPPPARSQHANTCRRIRSRRGEAGGRPLLRRFGGYPGRQSGDRGGDPGRGAVVTYRGLPTHFCVVAAHDLSGDARDDAVVGVGARSHHGARRHHAVTPQSDTGQDHRVGAEPAPAADVDRVVDGPLQAHRDLGVGVGVVLVGDVDVGTGVDVVTDVDRAVSHDVRPTTDGATGADPHHGVRAQVVVGPHP